jgi:hypothetical protein
MHRTSTDHWCSRCPATAVLLWASACDVPDTVGHWAIVTLKVVAGMVVVVLVFLPLMASLGAIRAAVRRVLASRGHDRKPE